MAGGPSGRAKEASKSGCGKSCLRGREFWVDMYELLPAFSNAGR